MRYQPRVQSNRERQREQQTIRRKDCADATLLTGAAGDEVPIDSMNSPNSVTALAGPESLGAFLEAFSLGTDFDERAAETKAREKELDAFLKTFGLVAEQEALPACLVHGDLERRRLHERLRQELAEAVTIIDDDAPEKDKQVLQVEKESVAQNVDCLPGAEVNVNKTIWREWVRQHGGYIHDNLIQKQPFIFHYRRRLPSA